MLQRVRPLPDNIQWPTQIVTADAAAPNQGWVSDLYTTLQKPKPLDNAPYFIGLTQFTPNVFWQQADLNPKLQKARALADIPNFMGYVAFTPAVFWDQTDRNQPPLQKPRPITDTFWTPQNQITLYGFGDWLKKHKQAEKDTDELIEAYKKILRYYEVINTKLGVT